MVIGGFWRQLGEGESGMDGARASSADIAGQRTSHETQPQLKCISLEARVA